eukprot:CAMPEP_0119127316 /NCGR_PEP_ID=MMETSP1310-20130426/5912_1 /TAXON_ID=464262 /ORGANISM="Genus nov. species nov., Strain RCC2339" /LENGTH=1340 /DNA_ID=CAMNT_0007117567 /DNA_START=1 /DNA_END=4020 /DNA_ORIENTATION=+
MGLATFDMPLRCQVGTGAAEEVFATYGELTRMHGRLEQTLRDRSGSLLEFLSQLCAAEGLYSAYIENYGGMMHTVRALETDTFFGSILASTRDQSSLRLSGSSTHVPDLRALLSTPIRHITQYTFFFKTLCEVTPRDHLDYDRTVATHRIFERLHARFVACTEIRPPGSPTPEESLGYLRLVNGRCADCGSPRLTHVSSTLGLFLCEPCAHVHGAHLPDHVSMVFAVDDHALRRAACWTHHPKATDILAHLERCSNTAVNCVWEFTVSPSRPDASTSPEDRKQHIIRKYQDRAFFHPEYRFVGRILMRGGLTRKWQTRQLFLRGVRKAETGPRGLVVAHSAEGEQVYPLDDVTDAGLMTYEEDGRSVLQIVAGSTKLLVDLGGVRTNRCLLLALHQVAPQVASVSPFRLDEWLDRKGWLQAARDGNTAHLREFIEQSPSYCDVVEPETSKSAGHIVCEAARLDVAELLLASGADFLQRARDGDTVLHELFARDWTGRVAEAEAFLEKVRAVHPHATFNEANEHGETMLHKSVTRGRSSLVPYLLRIPDINVDCQTSKGATPLYITIRTDQAAVAIQLVEHGADLFVKTHRGDDVLTAARQLNDKVLYDMVFDKYETRRIAQTTNIIQEFIDTEEAYRSDLEIITFIFRTKLVGDLPVSERCLRALFANIEQIYGGCSSFLEHLRPVINLPPEEQDVGRRILAHRPYFESYRMYCMNQTVSAKSLQMLQTDAIFRDWRTGVEGDLKERGMAGSIESYLIKPVQRICRHQLLLRELTKYTASSYADYARLEEAATLLRTILDEANEGKRHLDHIEEIMAVLAANGIAFSRSSRFVEEGPLRIKGNKEQMRFFLFTDVFIVARGTHPQWDPAYIGLFIDVPIIWRCKNSDTAFDVVSREKSKRIAFEAGSLAEREHLIDRITDLLVPFTLRSSQVQEGDDTDQPLQRPIFFEEIYDQSRDTSKGSIKDLPTMTRDEVSLDPKLAKKIGVNDEDSSVERTVMWASGRDAERRTLRQVLQRVAVAGKPYEKHGHKFVSHYFKAPRWCDFCKKFIYGVWKDQGKKCKTCSYSAHFKCWSRVGKSCYGEEATRIWRKREMVDMALVLVEKEGVEKISTVLLFNDTLEFLCDHDAPAGTTSAAPRKDRPLQHTMTIGIESGKLAVKVLGPTKLELRRDVSNLCMAMTFVREEEAGSFLAKLVPAEERKSMRASASGANQMQESAPEPKSWPEPTERPRSAMNWTATDGPAGGRGTASERPVAKAAAPMTEQQSQQGLAQQAAKAAGSRPQAPVPPAPLQRSVYTVVASFPFEAASEAEMTLRTGDRIIVQEMTGEWWFGEKEDGSASG